MAGALIVSRRGPIRSALVRAARERRLAFLLWAVFATLALAAVVPVSDFLSDTLARRPEGDVFLERLDLPLFADVFEDQRSVLGALPPLVGAFAGLALLANAFVAGGALETLLRPDRRSVALRFARGGGRYFGRFLRMGLVAAPLAAATGALLSAPFWIVRSALSPLREGARYFLGVGGALVALFGALLVLLALDLARVRVARDDARRAVRIFLRTAFATIRRPLPALGLWLALAATFAAPAALLAGARWTLGTATGVALVALVVLHQATIALRAFQRIALWAGEIRLDEARASRRPRIGG